MNILAGRKLNISQFFMDSGEVIPVTVIQADPMTVVQVKAATGKDKYAAVQVGTGQKKKLTRAVAGHVKGLGKFVTLTEFRVANPQDYKVGQKLDARGFQVGELVKVIGRMKGRGFAGAMKRHGFKGFPASHGHNRPRSVGSIGQRFPQHTLKGMRMAGRMGGKRITTRGLKVINIDRENNIMALRGAVPGRNGTLLEIVTL